MSDERFRGLLREKRPRLVQAVQVWDDLRSSQVVKDYDHPEIWQRVVFEPREAAWHQERARRKERSGRGGITKLFAAPDDAYEITREQWELHRPAFQLWWWLEDLGWRWDGPPEGKLKPKRGSGGGEWLPRWWISTHTPEEADRLPLRGCTEPVPKGEGVVVMSLESFRALVKGGRRAWSKRMASDPLPQWWIAAHASGGEKVVYRALPLEAFPAKLEGGETVEIWRMPSDPLPRNEGVSLRRAVVEALVAALRLPRRNDHTKHLAIADTLPDCFAEPADPGARGWLARTLENIARRG